MTIQHVSAKVAPAGVGARRFRIGGSQAATPAVYLGMQRIALALVALLGVAAYVWYQGNTGDYPQEVAPVIDALARGDAHYALHHQAFLGLFSILLRVPFVVVGRAFDVDALMSYRLGALPCVAAAVILGVALTTWARSERRTRGVDLLIVLLAVATPTAGAALDLGHPEEILCGALTVGALTACLRRKYLLAAVLMGCAVSTKQWALLAVGPVLLAAGREYWWRVAAGAGAIAALFALPLLFADHQGFVAATKLAASAPPQVRFENWWYLIDRNMSFWLAQKMKPAIVLSAVPLTLIASRRGNPAARALPLLALLFLARCAFDPQTQHYYHLPLVLTLLAWDVQVRRPLPYTCLSAVLALIVTNSYLPSDESLQTASVFYLLWTLALGAYLLHEVLRARRTHIPDLA